MSRTATKRAPRKPLPKRSEETRARLLEAAGEIFAEKGYERTTGKEIAARAGINAAAVNYHFGGVDELYLAVIEEARAKAYTVDRLSTVIAGISDPMAKLLAILEHMVQLAIGPFSSSWMGRIFAREMVSPSRLFDRTHWRDTEKRFALMRELIAECLGLPADAPEVAYASWNLTAPVTLLLNADRKRFAQMFPGIDVGPDQGAIIADHLARYAIGGLKAVQHSRTSEGHGQSRSTG
jgi:AcrR family transcriptional regulator